MNAAVVTTSRERWERLLAGYPCEPAPEHRRAHPRKECDLGNAALAFDVANRPQLRTGRVLNASAEGVLLRLREEISPTTTVLLRLTLARGQATFVGRIVHCTPTVGAYKVGIHLLFDKTVTRERPNGQYRGGRRL